MKTSSKPPSSPSVSVCFQDQLLSTIHGAFQVAVEITVQEVTKLLLHQMGELREQVHDSQQENISLKQRLQEAEEQLELLRGATTQHPEPQEEMSAVGETQSKDAAFRLGDIGPLRPRDTEDTSRSGTVHARRTGDNMSGTVHARGTGDNMSGTVHARGTGDNRSGTVHASGTGDKQLVGIKEEETQKEGVSADYSCFASMEDVEDSLSLLQSKMLEEWRPEMLDHNVHNQHPGPSPALDILHMAVCKETSSAEYQRSPSLPQEEPGPPHIKEEQEEPAPPHIKEQQEELLQSPEEPGGSMLTLLAVKSEVNDEDMSSHYSEVEVVSGTEVTEDTRVHTGKNSFQCKLYNKSFRSSYCIVTHQPVHSAEKHFHCKHGDKSFIQSSDLKRHQRVHTGEKPFRCEYCDKSFSQLAHLQSHRRTHTKEKPFHCKHCDKRFSESCHLKTHQRLHTGERPYQCAQCKKSFNESGSLKRHQRIHTGEKPFQCKYCGKRFNDSANLKRHQYIHTKGN